jgi:hypothetical protein
LKALSRKRTTLDGKWKVVKKYRDFSGGLILMGGLPSNFNLGHFKMAFHLMDPNRNLQNLLPNVSKFRWYVCIFTCFKI